MTLSWPQPGKGRNITRSEVPPECQMVCAKRTPKISNMMNTLEPLRFRSLHSSFPFRAADPPVLLVLIFIPIALEESFTFSPIQGKERCCSATRWLHWHKGVILYHPYVCFATGCPPFQGYPRKFHEWGLTLLPLLCLWTRHHSSFWCCHPYVHCQFIAILF